MSKRLIMECKSCQGTGVYQGVGECDGAFVVCTTCQGTGMIEYHYTPFTGLNLNPKCKRVYNTSCGYAISDEDVIRDDGVILPFSMAGCTYDDWLNGVPPLPIKFLGCPLLTDQGGCHAIDGFVAECNRLNGGYIGVIPTCKNKKNSAECWDRFDEGVAKK